MTMCKRIADLVASTDLYVVFKYVWFHRKSALQHKNKEWNVKWKRSAFLAAADYGKSEMQVEKWETPTLQHVKEF